MPEILIAIDGGGTRTRAVAFSRAGGVLGEGAGGPSNHLAMDRGTVRESLARAISGALAAAGADAADVRLVAAGLAGVDWDGEGASEASAILAEAGFPRSAVYGDMVAAHAGALDGRPGVVAAAGTGAVYLGVAPGGRRFKAGGWGYLFGDEGSAYWLGRMALNAASRSVDGRERPTLLVDAVCRALGIRDFAQALSRIYGGNMTPAEIAALSVVVPEAADAGDAVACRLLERAGDELAWGAEAVIRRLGMEAGCEVSWQGAILEHCRPVHVRFGAALAARVPGVRLVAPAHEPVYGAWLLGRRAAGWETHST